MDADELAHISATLIGAIAEARAYAKTSGIDDEFREILRHAGDMHDLLIEALMPAVDPNRSSSWVGTGR